MNLMKNINFQSNSGQVGLVVLLVMTAMLTVGVGAVSRSTQDLRITRQEVESSRAFNAAEVGVEQALAEISQGQFTNAQIGQIISRETSIEDLEIDYEIQPLNSIDTTILEGEVVSIDVSKPDRSNSSDILYVDWAIGESPCSNNVAKVLVSVVNSQGTNIVSKRYGFSKCSPHQGLTPIPLNNRAQINLVPGDEIVKVKVLNNSTRLSVTAPNWTLPIQMYQITSTASAPDSDETKVIQLERTQPTTPTIFDYTLVSGTTILMN